MKKLTNKRALLVLAVLVLLTAIGARMYSSITMGDDEWIGLGATAGRIVFDDQLVDRVYIKDAHLLVGSTYSAGNTAVTVDDTLELEKYEYGGDTWAVVQGYDRGAAEARPMWLGASKFYFSNNVGIKDLTPSYTLDVNGQIRATGDVIANNSAFLGDAAKDIDSRASMPIAVAEAGQGGYFFYNADVSVDTDLTGVYSAMANVERQVWVRWLVYDVTAATKHYGETVLAYTGGTSSVVIADEGANDLLFKVASGTTPNPAGYVCLDVVGDHTYEVVLTTMWH